MELILLIGVTIWVVFKPIIKLEDWLKKPKRARRDI